MTTKTLFLVLLLLLNRPSSTLAVHKAPGRGTADRHHQRKGHPPAAARGENGIVDLADAMIADGVTLITFDVDGTLIHGTGSAAAEGAHAMAFSHAVGLVLGDGRNPTLPVATALPRRLYQGSTDGLILLRLARAALQMEPSVAVPKLDDLMQVMFEYIQQCDDMTVARHLTPLPGVIETLTQLAKWRQRGDDNYGLDDCSGGGGGGRVLCGLVTGNVEGIARRKMKAVGIWDTGALHAPCPTQPTWEGTQDIAFLGGFGSDYCSGDIDNIERNHLDRAEQIAIAVQRCQRILSSSSSQRTQAPLPTNLTRVVHVGDAPADVLAAKAFSQRPDKDPKLVVGMVAVATGSYEADELRALAGETIPGQWEPVVLERGMEDPSVFLKACGVLQSVPEDNYEQ